MAKAAIDGAMFGRSALRLLCSAFVCLLLMGSCATARRHYTSGSVAIPVCPVEGIAALADDRHVAINCWPPVSSILIVDTQQNEVVATVPHGGTILANRFAFAATSDGGFVWYGLVRESDRDNYGYGRDGDPEKFGLQKSFFRNGAIETELLARDTGPELQDRGVLAAPINMFVSARFDCAVWGDNYSLHQYDLLSNEDVEILTRDVRSVLQLRTQIVSCYRNDQGQVVSLFKFRRPGSSASFGGRSIVGFEARPLEEWQGASPYWVRLAGLAGVEYELALQKSRFLLFSNFSSLGDAGASLAENFDYDAGACGLNTVHVLDLSGAGAADCLASFPSRTAPIGYVHEPEFSTYGKTCRVAEDLDAVECSDWQTDELAWMSVSPVTGRLVAWIERQGEVHFRVR